jgi:quercetin dioxygenase-like cupin family protein
MIRRSSERIVEKPQHKFGAPGFITVRNLINEPEELNSKGRLFSHTSILPGHGIGYHVHVGDGEIYYILSGKGEYNDNGAVTTVEAGDVTFCPPGEGHGILCVGDEPLELIALILFE